MSSQKKTWKNPELIEFASADDAIAYYSKRGMREHVEAIRILRAKCGEHLQPLEEEGDAPEVRQRKAGGR